MSTWRAAARALDRGIALASAAAELMLAALVALVLLEVAARGLLGRSFEGTEELAGYLLVAVVFLGLAGAVRDGELLHIDSMTTRLGAGLQARLEAGCLVLALLVTLALVAAWVQLVLSSFVRGVKAPTGVATPLWLPQLVMPLGGTLLAFALLARLLALRRRRAVPPGANDGD